MSDLFASAALSVSELNRLAKNLLEDNLAGLWIAGEVSNLTRAASGHYYFSLKDSHAQVRCAMFKGTAQRFPALKEGDHIEVCGRIGIYEARGEFQITVSEVRLKGLGRLYEAYERLKAVLQAEGLFAAERKRPLPERPERIGVVTSLAAAALRDVVSTLKRRAPEIPVIVYPAAVQGAEDLWSFNEEPVARAIAACRIPVVSGVGHETDFTLADFAADVRAPTPTGAAELVSPNRAESLQSLRQAEGRLKEALRQRYYDASQKIDWLSRQIRHPRQKLDAQRVQAETLSRQLRHALQTVCRFQRQNVARQSELLRHLRPDTRQADARLAQLQADLARGRQRIMADKAQLLEKQAGLLQAVSPQHILARGFSVVKNSRGQVIRDAALLKQGQKLHITFFEGEADVRVTGEQAQPDLFDFS